MRRSPSAPPSTEVVGYLTRHAEPEAGGARLPGGLGHVVVLPACGEGAAVRDAVLSVPAPALAVVVVNGRVDAPPWVHARNAASAAALQELGRPLPGGGPHIACRAAPCGALAVVDRFTVGRRLAAGEGVGLARKIGADVALAGIATGALDAAWIHCTDADVRLPADYFAQTAALPPGDAAAVYAFVHEAAADPALAWAIGLYEASLHAYVDGLRWAGSPYAYHSIGSTMAVAPRAYAQVRGVPRRLAAEDFYLLGKLRKVGPVRSLAGAPIRIAGRVSQRVPFGTGHAMRQILAGEAPPHYPPQAFVALRAWLAALEAAAHAPVNVAAALAGDDAPWRAPLRAALQDQGAAAALARCGAAATTAAGRRRHLHTWFDALRTLRLVRRVGAAL